MTDDEELLENFKQHYCNIELLNDFYTTLRYTTADEMPDDVWLLFKAAKEALEKLDAVLWSDEGV